MMILAEQMLAQQSDATDLFFPILLIMVVIGLLIGSIALVRRKMLAGQDDSANDPLAGFSLSNLRQLVKEGKMTQEEYDAAKALIVAKAQRASEKRNPVKDPAPETKLDPEEPV